jgi:hypothetical protein
MASAILDGTNIDTSVFSYSAPKANPAGGKVVNLYNKFAKESLTFSTPLILTWGAQEGKDQQGNLTGKWTMSLQATSVTTWHNFKVQLKYLLINTLSEANTWENIIKHVHILKLNL